MRAASRGHGLAQRGGADTAALFKVESAIGARRIRSISKHGMLSLTNLMDVFFRKLSDLSSPVTGLLKSESFLKKPTRKVVN